MKATLLLPLLITGCAVFAGPPPGYPRQRPLSRDEVASIALNYTASRGYRSRVREMEFEGHEWEVHLAVHPPFRGQVEMKIDGWSGEILRAEEEVRHMGHRRHERDEDEDD